MLDTYSIIFILTSWNITIYREKFNPNFVSQILGIEERDAQFQQVPISTGPLALHDNLTMFLFILLFYLPHGYFKSL